MRKPIVALFTAAATGMALGLAAPALAHAGHPHGPHGGELIKAKGYTLEFIEKTSGETGNLTVYVLQGAKTVKPTSVTVETTAADGHKANAKMAAQGDHFSGPVPLDDPGAYTARVMAKVGKETLVGRFPFTR